MFHATRRLSDVRAIRRRCRRDRTLGECAVTAFSDHDTLAIDPGNEKSGYVWLRSGKPLLFGIVTNAELLKGIDQFFRTDPDRRKRVACEIMFPRGMPM